MLDRHGGMFLNESTDCLLTNYCKNSLSLHKHTISRHYNIIRLKCIVATLTLSEKHCKNIEQFYPHKMNLKLSRLSINPSYTLMFIIIS